MSHFTNNLRTLSARSRSVSALCRDLGINRQQFARYLNGATTPSPYNRRKIASHFGITVAELSAEPAEFAARHGDDSEVANTRRVEPATPAPHESLGKSLGSLAELKVFAGYYYSYLQTPSEPAKLLQSLVQLRLDGRNVVSIMHESLGKMPDGTSRKSTYEGLVSLLNGCLFIVDIETTRNDTILETVLRLPYQRKHDVLWGVIMGMTTGLRRMPFASITAWRFLGKKIDVPSKLARCGLYESTAAGIDPLVKEGFQRPDPNLVYPRAFDHV